VRRQIRERASAARRPNEIVFDHEPLERVAAEFNRYAPKPIEIVTPALRNLQITGAFATDPMRLVWSDICDKKEDPLTPG
jgi:ferric-dicitrate binding protein FerR (iron transport regulator)